MSAELAKRYFEVVSSGATGARLAAVLHPDVVVEEFPNKLFPKGNRFTFPDVLSAAERGQKVLRAQRFDVQRIIEHADHVAAEVIWTGVLAVPVGSLKAGDELRAFIASFIEFKDGKVYRQRQYDCYEPF